MRDTDKKLTTNSGAPVPDNQNALTAGPRGPMLLQDIGMMELNRNLENYSRRSSRPPSIRPTSCPA